MTAAVVMVNLALVPPAVTVTLWGTTATLGFPLESWATIPPVGAAPVSVTVPVELLPPTSVVGLKVNEDNSTGGLTVKTADAVDPE